MASTSTVLSLGYGSWGSVNLLPTLGFGQNTEEPPDRPGFQYTLLRNAGAYTLTEQRKFQLPRESQPSIRQER